MVWQRGLVGGSVHVCSSPGSGFGEHGQDLFVVGGGKGPRWRRREVLGIHRMRARSNRLIGHRSVVYTESRKKYIQER